jgi:hypothetical protein
MANRKSEPLSNHSTDYKYLIENRRFGKDLAITTYALALMCLHAYVGFWLFRNATNMWYAMAGLLAVTVMIFIPFYLPIIINNKYYISDQGMVFITTLFGKYRPIISMKQWSHSKDVIYRRLGEKKIRLSFDIKWTKQVFTTYLLFTAANPIGTNMMGSHAVYLIKGTKDQIDYIEERLSMQGTIGTF